MSPLLSIQEGKGLLLAQNRIHHEILKGKGSRHIVASLFQQSFGSRLFSRSRVNHPFHFGDTVCGNPPLFACSNTISLLGGDVNAVNLVFGNITLNPLNLGLSSLSTLQDFWEIACMSCGLMFRRPESLSQSRISASFVSLSS
jgi:hypothetical protein